MSMFRLKIGASWPLVSSRLTTYCDISFPVFKLLYSECENDFPYEHLAIRKKSKLTIYIICPLSWFKVDSLLWLWNSLKIAVIIHPQTCNVELRAPVQSLSE